MNIEKFMVGDWAIVSDFPLLPKVTRITENHFVRSHCIFEPINITENLLSENHIKYKVTDGGNVYYISQEKSVVLFYSVEDKKFYWGIEIPSINDSTVKIIGECMYVHDLQQISRKLGTELMFVVNK